MLCQLDISGTEHTPCDIACSDDIRGALAALAWSLAATAKTSSAQQLSKSSQSSDQTTNAKC